MRRCMWVSNLTRVEIENFQSIEYLTMPLHNTGVHWINGKPNVGKSAILKAVQALFTNVSNNRYKEMIRDGEDFFRVKGYFGEDDWVELIRGEGDAYTWVIDGQAGYSAKTQGKVPYEVKSFYDLYWTGDKVKRYLNFTLVGDQLFFVETSANDNTIILEKALGTDRLSRVGQYAESEKRDVRADLRTYRTFQEESTNKLERLTEAVNDGEEVLGLLDRLEATIDQEVGAYDKVSDLLEKMDNLTQIAQVVKTVEESLSRVDTDVLHNEIKVFELVEELYEKEAKLQELEEEAEQLKPTVTQEQLDELSTIIAEHSRVSALYEKEVRLAELKEDVERLKPTVTQEQVEELSQYVHEYGLISKLYEKEVRLSQLSVELGDAEREYEEGLQEKEDYLGQFEVCPFCERPIGEGHQH